MLKKLIIALAIAITIAALVTPVSAIAPAGWGSIMGGMWGCGCPFRTINGFGLHIWGGGPWFSGFAGTGLGIGPGGLQIVC